MAVAVASVWHIPTSGLTVGLGAGVIRLTHPSARALARPHGCGGTSCYGIRRALSPGPVMLGNTSGRFGEEAGAGVR